MTSRPELNIGFVGCGLIGRSHARGLSGVGGVRISSVFDIDRERAERFAGDHGDAAVETSAEAVIERSDAVYVCTWTAAHPSVVAAVAAAGKPLFCEKPLAVDLATTVEMCDAVGEAGVVNQVGLVLRHSPSFRWLKQQVDDPAAGPVMNIVFRDDQYLPIQGMYGSTWRGDRTRAGAGTLLEHSIHDLDLLRWLLGPISSVSAAIGAMHGLDGIDDQSSALLVAESGAQAVLTSTWHEVLSRPSQRRVEVLCRDAVLTLEGDWRGPVHRETSAGLVRLEGADLARSAVEVDGLDLGPDAAFIDSIRSGRPAYPDFELALDAHRLVDAAYRSAAKGGDPITPDP